MQIPAWWMLVSDLGKVKSLRARRNTGGGLTGTGTHLYRMACFFFRKGGEVSDNAVFECFVDEFP